MTELELVLLLIPHLDLEHVPEEAIDRMSVILGLDVEKMERDFLQLMEQYATRH